MPLNTSEIVVSLALRSATSSAKRVGVSISGMMNRPATSAGRSSPSHSSGRPKVRRGSPVRTLSPTIAHRTPIAATARPCTMPSRDTALISEMPISESNRNSGGPKLVTIGRAIGTASDESQVRPGRRRSRRR